MERALHIHMYIYWVLNECLNSPEVNQLLRVVQHLSVNLIRVTVCDRLCCNSINMYLVAHGYGFTCSIVTHNIMCAMMWCDIICNVVNIHDIIYCFCLLLCHVLPEYLPKFRDQHLLLTEFSSAGKGCTSIHIRYRARMARDRPAAAYSCTLYCGVALPRPPISWGMAQGKLNITLTVKAGNLTSTSMILCVHRSKAISSHFERSWARAERDQ